MTTITSSPVADDDGLDPFDYPLDPSYEYKLAGWLDGYHARDAEVSRLNWEADVWYYCANNRGKRPTDFYAAATDRLWAEASK